MADVQRDKLRDKLQVIEERVRRLRDLSARGREAFFADPVLQDAAIRNLQVAIEAMIDIAHHLVARLRLGTPKTYVETFERLIDAGILPQGEREVLHGMVRFRNRIVHLYGRGGDIRHPPGTAGGLREVLRRDREAVLQRTP